MQTREQTSALTKLRNAAGHAAITGSNVATALKKPIQNNASAADAHAAGFIFFTSASAVELLTGSWFRFGIDAAAATYCMVGMINQEGKNAAFNFVKNLPSKTWGLFKPAQVTTVTAPDAAISNNEDKASNLEDFIKMKSQ